MPQQSGNGRRLTAAEAKRRSEQSRRDRLNAQAQRDRMRRNAQVRSIPRRQAVKVPTKQLLPQALRSMQFAPRGHGFYDAYSNKVDTAMLAVSVGPCTPIEGFNRTTVVGWGPHGAPGEVPANIDLSRDAGLPTDNSVIMLFNPGRGAMRAMGVFRKAPDQSGDVRAEWLDIPQFPGGLQDECIPIRGSMQITNVSESLTRGGTVRFLRYNSGLSKPETSAEYDALADMIRTSARTQTMSGSQLVTPFQSNSYPSDFARSVQFTAELFEDSLERPAYSTVLVLIDAFFPSSSGFNNTYEVTCKVQRAYRFTPGTTLHTLAREIPVVPSEHHSKHVHKESSTSHAKPSFMDGVKDYAMNALTPLAGQVAGKLGARMLPRIGKALPFLAELPLLAL